MNSGVDNCCESILNCECHLRLELAYNYILSQWPRNTNTNIQDLILNHNALDLTKFQLNNLHTVDLLSKESEK